MNDYAFGTIGVDFDNTIVCYDRLFHEAAARRELLDDGVPATKRAIRAHLRAAGRHAEWIELQAEVYGRRMLEAPPFPGSLDLIRRCRAARVPLHVISHKTRFANIEGPTVDLHDAARSWLALHDLPVDIAFFEPTRRHKLRRIAALGCAGFVDDLPEFLADPRFPRGALRILFDPHDECGDPSTHDERATSWPAIESRLADVHPGLRRAARCAALGAAPRQRGRARRLAATLLTRIRPAGVPPIRIDARPVRGGRNNRIHRIDADGRRMIVKEYFRHRGDGRDRLDREYRFLEFAARRRLPVPKPIARDDERGLGLYSFIEGRPACPADVTDERIDEIVDWLNHLNRAPAPALDDASDACFRQEDQLAGIERRMSRLDRLVTGEPIAQRAARFVRQSLRPRWQELRSWLDARRLRAAAERRCVSPSDLGFHNVVVANDDRLHFVDFEYAGWDGPIKLVCDFFSQVAIPVPDRLLDRFVRRFEPLGDDPPAHAALIRRLLPAYRVKWCCILLNDFVAVDAERRRFAGPDASRTTALSRQLDAARSLLSGAESLTAGARA